MTDAYEVMVDGTFARPGLAFGASSYLSGFLIAHHAAVEAGESDVRLRPFLPSIGFQDIETAYGARCRRARLPGDLGRAETSVLSHLGDRRTPFHWLGNHVPPAARRLRSIVTVHDLMTGHYIDAGYHVPRRMRAAHHRTLRSLDWADGVIVSDDSARERILELAPGARVVVAPPGPGVVATLQDTVAIAGLDKPFLLLLGASGPHKRFEEFRQAFLRSALPGAGWMLVHAGRGTTWWDDTTLSFTGVSNSQIAWLLQNCRALAMPSSYEGWGMPVTEAAILGLPVLVSDRIPSRTHAATIAPVYIMESLGDPRGWEFLLDQVWSPPRPLTERRTLADGMWRDHVRHVDGLYTSLCAPASGHLVEQRDQG